MRITIARETLGVPRNLLVNSLLISDQDSVGGWQGRDHSRAGDLENVPENWLAADLHHGLGFEVDFLTDASAKATGKDHSIHQ